MWIFVVNEQAGNGRGKRTWQRIEEALTVTKDKYIRIAEKSEEAAARRVSEAMLVYPDTQAIVVIGGDGTLHGLLPILAGKRIPLGLIPAGSGNDTARAFRIPRQPLQALHLIRSGCTREVDLLQVANGTGKERLTLTALATGLDAAVAADVNASRYKQRFNALGAGALTYVYGLLRMLVTYKPRRVTVTVDGTSRTYERTWLIATTNVPSYGGGLRICPDARPDDGLLHVCVVHGLSALRLLRLFQTLLKGTHVKQPYVAISSGKEVRIVLEDEEPAMCCYGDGEDAGSTPVAVRILPAQLLILAEGTSG